MKPFSSWESRNNFQAPGKCIYMHPTPAYFVFHHRLYILVWKPGIMTLQTNMSRTVVPMLTVSCGVYTACVLTLISEKTLYCWSSWDEDDYTFIILGEKRASQPRYSLVSRGSYCTCGIAHVSRPIMWFIVKTNTTTQIPISGEGCLRLAV